MAVRHPYAAVSPAPAPDGDASVHERAAACFLDAESLGDGAKDKVCVTKAGKTDERDAVREAVGHRGCDLHRKPGLADAAGPEQRDQAC